MTKKRKWVLEIHVATPNAYVFSKDFGDAEVSAHAAFNAMKRLMCTADDALGIYELRLWDMLGKRIAQKIDVREVKHNA